MRKLFLLSLLFSTIFHAPAQADETIHDIFRPHLRNGQTIEGFLQAVLTPLRNAAKDGNSLTKADVADQQEKEVQRLQRHQLSRIIQYDMNYDTMVTEDELRSALEEQYKGRRSGNFPILDDDRIRPQIDRQLSEFMKLDTNGDKVLSYKEMSTLSDQLASSRYENRTVKQLGQYLALDPNQDGKLTADELGTLARSLFTTLDKDKNGVLSSAEIPSPVTSTGRSYSTFPGTCQFNNLTLPSDYFIYGAGSYAGTKINIPIDQSGHETTLINVVVNETRKPVVLILGAYEPNIWNISRTPDTKIIAAVVGGYHRQIVSGLEGVPLLQGSFTEKGGCGLFHLSPTELKVLNPLARHLFNKPADLFFGAEQGFVVVGSKEYDKSTLIMPSKDPLSFKSPDMPLAGKAGLEEAVKKGTLRKMTQQDADEWLAAYWKAREQRSDLPPIAGGDPRKKTTRLDVARGYVILKGFVPPAGLTGLNASVFILPKGLPMPQQNMGHSYIYDWNTMRCSIGSSMGCSWME